MDIEKTLKAITDSQLRAEKRMSLADQRADRAERRLDLADQRMDRFEVQLRATANLVRKGITMVQEMRKTQAEMQKSQRGLDYKFNALMDSQLRTEESLRRMDEAISKSDEKFNRLLEILRRKNGNGHK